MTNSTLQSGNNDIPTSDIPTTVLLGRSDMPADRVGLTIEVGTEAGAARVLVDGGAPGGTVKQQRTFRCSVQEGARSGVLTVWIDTAEVERLGEDAVIAAAKRKWHEMTGPSVGMNYGSLQVLLLQDVTQPTAALPACGSAFALMTAGKKRCY